MQDNQNKIKKNNKIKDMTYESAHRMDLELASRVDLESAPRVDLESAPDQTTIFFIHQNINFAELMVFWRVWVAVVIFGLC